MKTAIDLLIGFAILAMVTYFVGCAHKLTAHECARTCVDWSIEHREHICGYDSWK